MRADAPAPEIAARTAEACVEGVAIVTGPPGSGKTTALAQAAARLETAGDVTIVCSHTSGTRAMREALARHHVAHACADTLAGHCVRWLRSNYALADVSPMLRAGGDAASSAVVRKAAAGLLDLSWSMLRSGEVSLDLPFLSRPDAFLDEAAALFRQLRRARVGPAAFERGCRNGLDAFYGGGVERALVLVKEPGLAARASRRGRDALSATADTIAAQRRAEHDLATLLTRLYEEYLAAAHASPVLSDEDIVDTCVSWLERDLRAARTLAARLRTILVDDAEDAEPGLSDLLTLLLHHGLRGAAIAGWEESAIDGFTGRRSLLDALEPRERIGLTPNPAAVVSQTAKRFDNEPAEMDGIATAIHDFIAAGVAPDEIAVLTRSHDAAAVYAGALAERGVPILPPRDRFASERDVLDWFALAAAVADPCDHAHLLRVLSSGVVGLSDASLFAICDDPASVTQLALDVGADEQHRRADQASQRTALARNVLEGTADHRLSAPARATIQRFRAQLVLWREKTAGMGPAEMLHYLATAGGFDGRWRQAATHEQARLLDDRRRAIEAVGEEAQRYGESLPTIIRKIEDDEVALRPALRSNGTLACEAIVDCKGEHWRHVFVVGLAHERFPRVYVARAMAFTKRYGLIVRENVAPGAAQTAKFAWYYAKFDAKTRYLKEERRALRYALSRGTVSATATGFGRPPRWATDQDLLADLGA